MLLFSAVTVGFADDVSDANGIVVVVSDGSGAKRTPVIGSTPEAFSVFGAAGFNGGATYGGATYV